MRWFTHLKRLNFRHVATWLKERRDRKYKAFTENGEQSALHNLKKISNVTTEPQSQSSSKALRKAGKDSLSLKGKSGKRPELDREQALAWATGKQ